MNGIERCTRCSRKLTSKRPHPCWYCGKPLCVVCSDSFGVCGCPGSDKAQQQVVKALVDYKRGAGGAAKRTVSGKTPRRKAKAKA